MECAPAVAARGVLPFAAPHMPPGERWAYYDTQTGERLRAPVLIEAPDTSERVGALAHSSLIQYAANLVRDREDSVYSSAGTAVPALQHHAHPHHRLTCVGATDKGMQRPGNEDKFGLFPEIGLAVVADGMGGAAAGDVAASMAVEFICEPFADTDVTWHRNGSPSENAGLPLLLAAIERANHCIYSVGEQTPAWKGMGTTIACVLAHGDRAVVAHVGDSRVYRLRDRHLVALTEDHSYYRELVRHGLADPDRPDDYAGTRHMLTRALGTRATVEVDARLVDVSPGDQFLLASDGLHGVVSQRTLTEILLAHPNPDDAVERLIARANDLGGPDNITAVVVQIG